MRVGHNGIGETFWTVTSPPELGSIDFSLRVTKKGLQVGDETISWAALDEARTNAFHGAALTDTEAKAQATRCSCHGSDDYCPCQNVPDSATQRHRLDTTS